jgi:hypothetical protein
MTFDTANPWVRWMLHVYNNRRHDGEIWLAVRRRKPTAPPHLEVLVVEQNSCPDDVKVLGEVRTRHIDGKFVHDIIPLQSRSVEELKRMQEQVEEHKKYRAELYKHYSIAERIKDLGPVE